MALLTRHSNGHRCILQLVLPTGGEVHHEWVPASESHSPGNAMNYEVGKAGLPLRQKAQLCVQASKAKVTHMSLKLGSISRQRLQTEFASN